MNNNTLFMSDLHLGHKSICRFRSGFNSLEEHDSFIKDILMGCANKRTKIYLLGDLAFTDEAGDFIVSLSEKCVLEIVLGNHDTDSKERMNNLFKYARAGIRMHGLTSYKESWLSHCPIHPEEMRKKDFNIHGHLHDKIIDDPRYFNVSCESVLYQPRRYDSIYEEFFYS